MVLKHSVLHNRRVDNLLDDKEVFHMLEEAGRIQVYDKTGMEPSVPYLLPVE